MRRPPSRMRRPLALSAKAGRVITAVTLAKAKKRKRPPAPVPAARPTPPMTRRAATTTPARARPRAAIRATRRKKTRSSDHRRRRRPRRRWPHRTTAMRRPAVAAATTQGGVEVGRDRGVEGLRRRPSDASPLSALEFGAGRQGDVPPARLDVRRARRGPGTVLADARTGDGRVARVLSGRVRDAGLRRQRRPVRPFRLRLRRRDDARERHRRRRLKFRDFLGGIKVRIPFGTFIPNVSVAYGQQVFEIAQTQNTHGPAQARLSVRPAGAGGARDLHAHGRAGRRRSPTCMVLDPGSGADHIRVVDGSFPKRRRMASMRRRPRVQADRIDRRARRRRLSAVRHRTFIPTRTRARSAGAVDRYIAAWAGLEVVLDGQGGAAAATTSRSSPPSAAAATPNRSPTTTSRARPLLLRRVVVEVLLDDE